MPRLNTLKFERKLGIRPGGFGILMTKNFADELLYSEKGNEVMFIKYLPHVESQRYSRVSVKIVPPRVTWLEERSRLGLRVAAP